ncbi:transcription termination factor MTERF8, chloroplastic [Ananas comosus]|uniref:Transcription termination factor MTERF8, chloroplastic n=2 Tax=Ananas comosus TaxID=4615 RepID=A0A6P5FLK0_ANACO|nr:transcription termination factor MTERF8, chloroplastic [Ananas comosus]
MAPPLSWRPSFFYPDKTLIPPPPPQPLTSPPHSTITNISSLSFPAPHLLPLRHPLTTPPSAINAASPPLPLSPHHLLLHHLALDDGEAAALLRNHPELESASPDALRRRLLALRSAEAPGLSPAKLSQLLAAADSELLPSFVAGVNLLKDHGIPREELVHVLNNVNAHKVFGEKPLRELEVMILYLKRYGWPELVIRRPSLLNLDLETQLVPRVEFLINLGRGDEPAAAFLIRKLPAILSYTADHFRSHLRFWQSVGLTDEELFKIALVYPNIFSIGIETKLRPRVELLRQCGLDAEGMFKFLIKAPLFLSLSFRENLAKKLAFLVKIGHRHRTRELASALGASTRTSCENMQRVVELFFRYGLSCADVLVMSKKHPQVLQYNHASLEKKMEFLVEGMEREIGELLMFPAFLGYNLDDRIKLRYEMKKDVRGKGMSLNKLLSVASDKFHLQKSTSEIGSNL